MFPILSAMCNEIPKLHESELPGVPLSTLLIDLANSASGQRFFSNPIVAEHLKNTFTAYTKMLSSPASTKYLTE